nr:ribonuclease H-like domain-containing protein [Tanacetum cinerariifolium]
MTGSTVTPTITLSDKLALVTHHHLLTQVPMKLDFEEWNYGSWEYFFDQLCASYEDHKKSRTLALKTELRTIKLGDLSMEAYFQKVESLSTTLASLNSPVSEDDVVHYVIDGLPEMYNQVFGYMHYQDTFPDFKTVRALLTIEEMWLKSKSLATPVDSSSSSPMVLLADSGPTDPTRQATTLPQAFTTRTLHDPNTSTWNMDTGVSSHLNNSVTSLSTTFNSSMYQSVSVGDGHYIPVTNSGHNILPTTSKSLHLLNVLITPHIVKNLISVRQFVRDNNCTIEFDSFGFSVKDFLTRRVLLRCDSTVTAPSPIPHAFLVSQHTWHHRLGHPGSEVLRRLVSSNSISYNKEKPHVLCHACQLGKHVRLMFVSSNTVVVSSCFNIIHSDVWTSPIPGLLGFKYYVHFLVHY